MRIVIAGAGAVGTHLAKMLSEENENVVLMDEHEELVRPINFGDAAAGRGYTILDANGYRILVINAMGNVHVEPNLDSPFPFIDRVLSREEGRYDFSILDK